MSFSISFAVKTSLACVLLLAASAIAGDTCTDLDGNPEACPDTAVKQQQVTSNKPQAERSPDHQITGSPDGVDGGVDHPIAEPALSVAKGSPDASDVCTDVEGHAEACPDTVVNQQQATSNKPQVGRSPDHPITGSPDVSLRTENRELRTAFSNFVGDQKWLWTSPFRLRENDLPWLLPFTLGTVVTVASDTAIEKHLPQSQTTINRSRTFSTAAVGGFAGIGAGAYIWGRFTSNDHLRETGLLSAEAAADSLVATEVIKTIAGRDRPLEGNGRGNWFQGGASFPSEHAAAAWSIATVVAGQYPGWMTKLLAYGGAAAVSAARVTGREHFTSDALIGSALGWYIGQHVLNRDETASCPLFRTCSERSRRVASYGTFEKGEQQSSAGLQASGPQVSGSGREPTAESRQPKNMGSPYVPLDSWVYPAFDRLIALGYIQSAIVSLRPWTRLECARLLAEAAEFDPDLSSTRLKNQNSKSEIQNSPGSPDLSGVEIQNSKFKIQNSPDSPDLSGVGNQNPKFKIRNSTEAARLYSELNKEFALEDALLEGKTRNLSAQVESIYTRFTGISGRPLTDGYDFGQTIINDYGRPYQEGLNNVTGASVYATAGPLVFYMRGEYQHAPSAAALPASARLFISKAGYGIPIPPSSPVAATDRFEVLDAYAGLNVKNWQLTAGRQSLWWGPGLGSPLDLSDNIEPIAMVRLNRVSPFKLPSILGLLGPVRTEFFVGQLSGFEFIHNPSGIVGQWGHDLDPQPIITGQKLSFRPTANFEFSVARTTIYGGPGYPLTLYTLARSVFSTGNQVAGNPVKPGKRTSGLDFTYRLPGLRNWLTFYADGVAWDEYSPIAYADRSMWRAGLYLPRFPGINKLDLRAEGVYTDNPIGGAVGPGFYYSDATYLTGYQNAGNVIGSWIGRGGQGAQAWATYHLTPKNDLQLYYRHQKVSHEYIPGGGTLADVGLHADFWWRPKVSISGSVQYERYIFPVLTPSSQSITVPYYLATGTIYLPPLAATPQSNVTTSIQVTFWPGAGARPRVDH